MVHDAHVKKIFIWSRCAYQYAHRSTHLVFPGHPVDPTTAQSDRRGTQGKLMAQGRDTSDDNEPDVCKELSMVNTNGSDKR